MGDARSDRRGRAAERLAAWLLRLKGYRILERRLSTACGEIDLVARRGGVLVFVEVKRRGEPAAALGALGGRGRGSPGSPAGSIWWRSARGAGRSICRMLGGPEQHRRGEAAPGRPSPSGRGSRPGSGFVTAPSGRAARAP